MHKRIYCNFRSSSYLGRDRNYLT